MAKRINITYIEYTVQLKQRLKTRHPYRHICNAM